MSSGKSFIMIKKTISEFYTKETENNASYDDFINDTKLELGDNYWKKPVPEIPKELGACVNCEYYKKTNHTYHTTESCNHPDNTDYTYDYKGKHAQMIWQPEDKNKKLDCNLFEKKVPLMQRIKVRLGLK